MNWKHLLQIVGDEPLFETGLLLAGDIKPANVTHQLSRWTISGLLRQVRKGLYVLPSANYVPHPFLIANRLVKPSYVSLQSALALYGLIPEYVPVTTSVTTERPDLWDTSIGRYTVQHVKLDLFDSYRLTDLGPRQTAFIALPDKALLDLIYLLPGGDDPAYIESLRLKNLDGLDWVGLKRYARSSKLKRTVKTILNLVEREAQDYQDM